MGKIALSVISCLRLSVQIWILWLFSVKSERHWKKYKMLTDIATFLEKVKNADSHGIYIIKEEKMLTMQQ